MQARRHTLARIPTKEMPPPHPPRTMCRSRSRSPSRGGGGDGTGTFRACRREMKRDTGAWGRGGAVCVCGGGGHDLLSAHEGEDGLDDGDELDEAQPAGAVRVHLPHQPPHVRVAHHQPRLPPHAVGPGPATPAGPDAAAQPCGGAVVRRRALAAHPTLAAAVRPTGPDGVLAGRRTSTKRAHAAHTIAARWLAGSSYPARKCPARLKRPRQEATRAARTALDRRAGGGHGASCICRPARAAWEGWQKGRL
jgi:hypothetical protein